MADFAGDVADAAWAPASRQEDRVMLNFDTFVEASPEVWEAVGATVARSPGGFAFGVVEVRIPSAAPANALRVRLTAQAREIRRLRALLHATSADQSSTGRPCGVRR